ncbi:LysR substrate-binding domain-containing protein [Mesorhizobium kowhaii]|uniref:LysR substrate-binding domain-containing protein n=1 Tax=Mesorhizobium kowhaii TaxID=1300272 RepID=UPI0035E659AB
MNPNDAYLLRNLATFELAARVGGFSRAADELRLSRVAVSRQMAELEARLGQKLFHRNHRSVSLTAAGRALLDEVAPALGSIGNALNQTRRMNARPRLSITATAAFATYWLMPRMVGFNTLHPDVEINLVVSDSYLDLAAEEIDVAIRYTPTTPTVGDARMLTRETIFPVYSPRYPRRTEMRSILDLTKERLLFLKGSYRREASWPFWFQRLGLPLQDENGIAFNTYLNMFQAALEGQGVALAGRPLVDRFLADGTLLRIEGIAPYERDCYFLINCSPEKPFANAWCAWVEREFISA